MTNDDSLSRRRLLGSAGVLSSALLLARIANAEDAVAGAKDKGADSLVLRLNDNPELGKVGGFKIFDLGDDRVIVANTGKGLVARSAVCPHRGCDVVYQAQKHEFYCPCHRARFDEEGKVLQGPARTGLASYASDPALVVSKPAPPRVEPPRLARQPEPPQTKAPF